MKFGQDMKDVTPAQTQKGIQDTDHGQGGSIGHGAQNADDGTSGKSIS